jgi:hypothetical protein
MISVTVIVGVGTNKVGVIDGVGVKVGVGELATLSVGLAFGVNFWVAVGVTLFTASGVVFETPFGSPWEVFDI